MAPENNRFTVRRDGGLIVITMRGRILTVPFGETPRLSALGAIVGEGVDVDLRVSAQEARLVGEMLVELARQADAHLRESVWVPAGKPPAELEGIVP